MTYQAWHELVLEEMEDEMLIDPDGLFELLGSLSVTLTMKYDDGLQHLVWTRFPLETEEY